MRVSNDLKYNAIKMKRQLQTPTFFKKSVRLAILLLLAGCQQETPSSLDRLINKTLEVSDTALEQVSNLSPEDAKKEFKKLSQIEYKVLSLKKEISAAEFEGVLSVYGQKGYDCAAPLIRAEDMMILCKRRPDTYLRYIPQTVVGR